MKLLSKIKRWFRTKRKLRGGVYFSAEELSKIMSESMTSCSSTPICGRCASKPAEKGLNLSQLLDYPPSLERRLRMIFREGEMANPTALRYYSDKELDTLLVERSGVICRKAQPTQVISQRSGYKRKVNGKYNQALNSCGAVRTNY